MALVDRFTTHWISPHQTEALEWAALQGISYFNAGCRIVHIRTYPTLKIFCQLPLDPRISNPNATVADLRQENDRYDAHIRALHAPRQAQDTDLNTGTRTHIRSDLHWWYRTRGEKLRYCRNWVQAYESGLNRIQSRISVIDAVIQANRQAQNEFEKKCLRMAKQDEAMLSTLVGETRNLQTLIQGETAQGWDWRVGLPQQQAVKRLMAVEHAKRYQLYGTTTNNPVVTREAAYILGFQHVPLHDHVLGIGLYPNGSSLIVRNGVSVVHPQVVL